jgi:hypothetical protein
MSSKQELMMINSFDNCELVDEHVKELSKVLMDERCPLTRLRYAPFILF